MARKITRTDRWTAAHPIAAFAAGVVIIPGGASVAAFFVQHRWEWPSADSFVILGVLFSAWMVFDTRRFVRRADRP